MREKLIESLIRMCRLELEQGVEGPICTEEYCQNHGNECWKRLADYLITDDWTQQKWIPVEERLPEEHKRVLCYMVYGQGLLTIVQDNEWLGDEWEIDSDCVTHWMPLPEPPKEGE